MTEPVGGPPSPRAPSAALYSEMVRRPPAPTAAPVAPRKLTPLVAHLLGKQARPPMALAVPTAAGSVRLSSTAALRTARQLLLLLAQQLNLRHRNMLNVASRKELAEQDKGYCEKLHHLNRAFGDILAASGNFSVNLEHLPEDMARLIEAHLQHGRALLGNPALVMTDNLSYKSFEAAPGERPAPVLLKVPLDNRVTWLPTGHKLLHDIATRCPLPVITGQVANFYKVMADLAEARQRSSEHESNRRMFGEVVNSWRAYSTSLGRRS